MANLRAGLIGLGMMGRHHARVLRSLDGVDLVAVADPSGDRHGVAGGLPVGRSVEDLIAAGVDYVTAAVPTTLHEQVAITLAEAGVHCLVEKPLAPDTAAAQRVADAFASRGLVGAVGHIERYNPSLQHLRERLAGGELGEVYQVVTRRQGPFPARIADTLTADLTFYANGTVPTTWESIAKFRGVSEGDVVRFAIPKPEPLRTEHEAFRDAVLGKEVDIVTMQDGLATVRVAEAVLRSAATGTTQLLD